MSKPRLIDRPQQKCLQLPSSLVTAVDLQLYSAIDGRVPQGAWNRLVGGLLKDWLHQQHPTAFPQGENHGSNAND